MQIMNLKFRGEIVAALSYNGTKQKQRFIERWRKMYGKKFEEAEIVDVEYIPKEPAPVVMSDEERAKWQKGQKSNYSGKSKYKPGGLIETKRLGKKASHFYTIKHV